MMGEFMNDDVLIAIMDTLVSQSARSTAAALMLSSRRLYHEGGRLLLSGNVDLQTNSDVSSFIAFCLAEDASRTAYVRNITFTISPLSTVLAPSLAAVLPMFTGLKRLALTRADLLIRGHVALARAIASLTSLEELVLLKGSTSADILVTLQSNLRRLALSEVFVPRRLVGVRSFSELSTLSITYLWMDILVLEPYLGAFPHLRHLSVTHDAVRDRLSKCHRPPAFPCGIGGPQDSQMVRCINQAAQMDGKSWKVLEEFDTDLTTAWLLGLTCRVSRLRLYIPPEGDLRLLPEVLQDVRPDTLQLTLAGDRFLEHTVSIPSRLDTLTVTVALEGRGIDMLEPCVKHIVRCFALSGVHSLRLRFGDCNEDGHELSGEQTLPGLDRVGGWVHDIQDEIPSGLPAEMQVQVLG